MKCLALTLIAVCLAVAALAGCGNAADEKAAAQQAVTDYLHAFASGDGQAACARLTDTARAYVTGMAGTVGASDCPGAFERVRKIGGKGVSEIANDARVSKVHVTGQTARVELRSHGEDSIASLEKVGDSWKIASLPKS